ncbi:MAG TPA: DMT family transporter [Micromonospora sp.]
MSATGPLVLAAVLAAAVLHASWNAVAKAVDDRWGLFARAAVVGVAVAVAALPFTDPPASASWPWLAASVLVHVGYNWALIAAYRVGDFNQTYPLARGLGPLLVTTVAVLVIGERLTTGAAVGVALITGAVAVLGLTPPSLLRSRRPAVLTAVLTGLAIAGYTLIDGVGVRQSGSPLGYTLWMSGLQSLLTVAVLALPGPRRGRAGGTASEWALATGAGLMSLLAYGLVLWAQAHGTLAAVAALRESSVVVAAAIGVRFFGEPLGRTRVAASVAVAAGVVLLAAAG